MVIIALSTSTGEVVELSQMEGVIHARSTVHIKVIVRSCHNRTYHCTINYSIHSQAKGIVILIVNLLLQ